MKLRVLTAGLCAVALAGCQTSPKQVVLNLDTTDPKWSSKRCVAARKAVAQFDEHHTAKGALGIAGALAGVPVAGLAATAAINAAQAKKRERLNDQVRAACISDPLGKKRRVAKR